MTITDFTDVERGRLERFVEYVRKHHPDVAKMDENEVFWLTQYIAFVEMDADDDLQSD